MLGFYNYTVILTYLGMLVSFLGLSFAVGGSIQPALLCLMVSGAGFPVLEAISASLP